MKIELTKDGLKVNKFECRSVTVYKLEDGTFLAELFKIKGVTTYEPILDKLGRRQTSWDGKLLTKSKKLKKKIKSKTFEYSGIEMRDNTREHDDKKYFFATNEKDSNYINYYEPKDDAVYTTDETEDKR